MPGVVLERHCQTPKIANLGPLLPSPHAWRIPAAALCCGVRRRSTRLPVGLRDAASATSGTGSSRSPERSQPGRRLSRYVRADGSAEPVRIRRVQCLGGSSRPPMRDPRTGLAARGDVMPWRASPNDRSPRCRKNRHRGYGGPRRARPRLTPSAANTSPMDRGRILGMPGNRTLKPQHVLPCVQLAQGLQLEREPTEAPDRARRRPPLENLLHQEGPLSVGALAAALTGLEAA